MAEVSLQDCPQLAAELMELDEGERLRRIFQLSERAVAEDSPLLMILTGLALRDRDHYQWAEYLFEIASRIPGARHMALFELSVALGLQGRVAEAVMALEQLEAETPLSAYQMRYYAVQLARLGDVAEATRRTELAYELEPGAERECVALQQFHQYVNRFPAQEAVDRCRALQNTFKFRDVKGLVADVRDALAAGEGYSMIRLNDGEGSVLHLSVEDEAQYRELYWRNRASFHRGWFGHEGRIYDPDFLTAIRDFNDCIGNASCLGADITEHLKVRYRQGDVQNIPCLFNIIRKLEQVRDTHPERATEIGITDPVIHQFLLFDGELERLLIEQERIGLISSFPALPTALREKFGLKEVFYHRTPGEIGLIGATEPEPFISWHSRISDEVSRAVPGVLYLVAAGVMGKIYCDLIKRAGGVALDVGSVADIWMKAPTRSFWKQADEHILA